MNRTQLERNGYKPHISLWDDGFAQVGFDYSWDWAKNWVEFFTYFTLGLAVGFVLFN